MKDNNSTIAIGNCGVVGVGMAFMKEVCYSGGRLRDVIYTQTSLSVIHRLFPVACNM